MKQKRHIFWWIYSFFSYKYSSLGPSLPVVTYEQKNYDKSFNFWWNDALLCDSSQFLLTFDAYILHPFLSSVFSLGDKPAQITEREEGCGFAQLRVPSAKEQKPLDNISTKLYVGTEVRR